MSDTETRPADGINADAPGIKNFLLRVYCRLLIMGALYVLSIGPMYWHWYDARHMGQGSPLTRRAVIMFYAPLATACEYVKPLDDWVEWYIGVWTS